VEVISIVEYGDLHLSMAEKRSFFKNLKIKKEKEKEKVLGEQIDHCLLLQNC
jgi:hypothetical protein